MQTSVAADPRPIAPLSSARFLETHVTFERSSTQQDQIRDALAAYPLPARASALSIGPGSGILDGPLLARLAPGRALRYVGVEPNPLQSQKLEARLAGLPVDAAVVTSTFEGFTTREVFDVVWVIHTHYYFASVSAGLERASRLVAPGGRLILAAAPRGALNRLAQAFWSDHAADALWFAEEIASFLESTGRPVARTRIDARLDVTACFGGAPRGDAIRDFVVQAEVSARPGPRAWVDGQLRAMGREETDGRWTVPHPVDLFELAPAG